jgi:signal transduction histidine kinase/CheY-like chemotaxis protein
MLPTCRRPQPSSAEPLSAAFAVLDLGGTIVAVDPAWSDSNREDAPFGHHFAVGVNYPDLCDTWPQRHAPDIAEAVRAVLSGDRRETRVDYEYPDEARTRRAEMRVARFLLRGIAHAFVLHVERQPSHQAVTEAEDAAEPRAATVDERSDHPIEARAQAVDAMKLKAEFMVNLNHEIRTPMNGIIGMTELALETNLTDEQRDYLLAVKASAQSLLTTVSNVFNFSNLESGRLVLAEAMFSLRDTLDSTLESLTGRARNKGIELLCEVDPAAPDRLIGDSERLGVILKNLIDNAIKFTERGEVTVRVLAEDRDRRMAAIRFDVVDTGIGIDPSRHRLIFQSFAQADGSSTRRHGGAGLGLTIAARLVQLMDSRIEVASEPGKGSTFSFTLSFRLDRRRARQAERRDEQAVSATNEPAVAGRKRGSVSLRSIHNRTILVAENNPVRQRMIRSVLERAGHCVELVDNGRDVVRRVGSGGLDLVLMDLELPVLDGFAATALIRQREKTNGGHVPIVALTSPPVLPDRARFRRAGMDDVLACPFETDELDSLLERIAAGDEPTEHASGSQDVGTGGLPGKDDGDPELTSERVASFLEQPTRILEPVVHAIEQSDREELEHAANRLQGTLGSLGASRATEEARRLEVIARTGDLHEAESVLTSLRAEVNRVEAALQAYSNRSS